MPLDINGNIISSADITSLGVFKSKVNRDGLVLYYDAGNKDSYVGSGTNLLDLTANNTGTLTNGVSFSTNNGGEFTFDGIDDYINLGNIPLSNPISVTTNFTIEQIFKPTGYQAGTYFGLTNMLFRKGSDSTFNYATQLSTDTIVAFIKRTSGEGLIHHNFTVPSMLNNINVLTFTIEGGNLVKCYMNGVYISTSTISGLAITSYDNDPSAISNPTSGTMAFIGKYYICRLYNRTLNPYEIAENFQAQRGRFGI